MNASGTAGWPPEELWRCFRLPVPEQICLIPSGFSPDLLFRVQILSGTWALRSVAQSPHWTRDRIAFHQLLRKANEIAPDCIPLPPPVAFVIHEGRAWELLPWVEGMHKAWNQLLPQHWGLVALFLARVHVAFKAAGATCEAPLCRTQSILNRSLLLKKARGELNAGQMAWPTSFANHPGWVLVRPRLKELVQWALEDLARVEGEIVRIQTIHGDPHLGNLLWKDDLPAGWIDYLGQRDCLELDIARLSGSHGLDPFGTCELVCQEYRDVEGKGFPPRVDHCQMMMFSGLVARIFRWRVWLLEGKSSVPKGLARIGELLDQVPLAISWRQKRTW